MTAARKPSGIFRGNTRKEADSLCVEEGGDKSVCGFELHPETKNMESATTPTEHMRINNAFMAVLHSKDNTLFRLTTPSEKASSKHAIFVYWYNVKQRGLPTQDKRKTHSKSIMLSLWVRVKKPKNTNIFPGSLTPERLQ
jgi:hypothetical protein